MILVDTSVWIDHLRKGNTRLARLLDDDQVMCHPFVIGELACGHLRNRVEILEHLGRLPEAKVAMHEEVLHFLESDRLHGRGLGWIDVHLLASARLSGCAVLTQDRSLRRVAMALGLSA